MLVSPVVIYQIWAFLSPALKRHEKKVIIPALYFGVFLFAAGVYLSYTRALTAALQFLLFFGEDYFDQVGMAWVWGKPCSMSRGGPLPALS